MFFQNKINRVLKSKDDKKEIQSEFTEEELPLEKKDIPALIIAGLVVLVPALLFVILAFVGVIWLFFRF